MISTTIIVTIIIIITIIFIVTIIIIALSLTLLLFPLLSMLLILSYFIIRIAHTSICYFNMYYLTSFNYGAKEAREVGLSCRCHLSDSQIASSLENMLERITWL